jgi:hypothetical protein
MLQQHSPEPEPGLELELELELELVSLMLLLPVPETVLVMALVLALGSVPETAALPPRPRPCLDHRPPEAQHSSDDQMLYRHPAQRPRIRTRSGFLR